VARVAAADAALAVEAAAGVDSSWIGSKARF